MVQLNAWDPEDGPDTLVGKCVDEQLPASPFRHELNIMVIINYRQAEEAGS